MRTKTESTPALHLSRETLCDLTPTGQQTLAVRGGTIVVRAGDSCATISKIIDNGMGTMTLNCGRPPVSVEGEVIWNVARDAQDRVEDHLPVGTGGGEADAVTRVRRLVGI